MFGLQKIALMALLLATLAGSLGFAYTKWKQSVVEEAGTKATAEALMERDSFESEQYSVALEELEALRTRMESIESEFNSFEELQKLDWDSELQTAPDDFANRATVATERVFHARQQLTRPMNSLTMVPQLLLSALFICAYAALVYIIVMGNVETSDSMMPVLLIIVGSLTSSMTSVMSFWFGSSSGSKEKSRTEKGA